MKKTVAGFDLVDCLLVLLGGFVVVVLLLAACQASTTEKKTGTLAGVEVGIDAQAFFSGQGDVVTKVGGRVFVTTDDGEEVRAYYPEDMEDDLRFGQTLEVEKTKVDGEDAWVVTRIVAGP